MRYDRRAHEDSISRIQAFLRRYLTPSPPATGLEAKIQQGTRAVDPDSVGADLPPVGRSVFDRLFSRMGAGGPRYDVPFPLSKVIDRIRSQLGAKPVAISSGYGPVTGSGIRKVLIPLGRSLHRFAAAPDFFASPRAVIAVDGEPREIAPGRRPLRLNDRLFLGYQEQARVLEVISYNEQALRFEFQVVEDYAGDLQPKVYYANRVVCRSCHQNGSPIFSKAGWDETNGNSLIAERLGEVRKDFYGFGYRSSGVGPAAVDNATDRANMFSVYQLLWRKACGDDRPAGRRCRAAAVIAMLQQRLSASTAFDRDTRRYRMDYLGPVTVNWRTLWPQGLLVPNPNIPNREPLLTIAQRIEFDAHTYLSELEMAAGEFHRQGGQWVAELQLRHQASKHHVRLATGHALEKLRIIWPVDPGSGNALANVNRFNGSVEVQLMDDFSPVIEALESLRDETPPPGAGDPLGADRFDAVGLMWALMPALGLAASQWCCDTYRPLPLPVAHAEITTDAVFKKNLAEHGALSAFIRNCGACHRTRMPLPPNYLMGDQVTVRRNIAHCAERIDVRLSMWDLAADERPKSPMPPPHSLKAHGHTLSDWRAGRDLATLRTYVGRILKAQRGDIPTVGELLRDGYDATRGCLDTAFAGNSAPGHGYSRLPLQQSVNAP